MKIQTRAFFVRAKKALLLVGAFYLLPAWLSPSWAVICSTDANIAILDDPAGAPVSIEIDVPTSPGTTVTDLDFQLSINHTWVGDLIVTLESPAGKVVNLVNRPGSPATFFGCAGEIIDATLDDGHNIDLVYFVEGALSYSRPNTMSDRSLRVAERIGSENTVVQSNGVQLDAVYAVDSDNNVVSRPYYYRDRGIEVANIANPSPRGNADLFFIADEGYARPNSIYRVDHVADDDIDLSDIDYVVIADAS